MAQIEVYGIVATTPRSHTTTDGKSIISFRFAETNLNAPERPTNWFTVTAFGSFAETLEGKVSKGSYYNVTGDLTVRDWDNGESTGTSVGIEALIVSVATAPVSHECNCSDHNTNTKERTNA